MYVNGVQTDTNVEGTTLLAGSVTALRWIGFVRTNSAGYICLFGLDGDYLQFARASECAVQSITTTPAAILTDGIVCPDSRVKRILFALTSASGDIGAYVQYGNNVDTIAAPGGSDGSRWPIAWTGGSLNWESKFVNISISNYIRTSVGTGTLSAQSFELRR